MTLHLHVFFSSSRWGTARAKAFAYTLLATLLLMPSAAHAAHMRLQGVTIPTYNAQLSFPVPGVVGHIAVRPGQFVRAGDLLMRLNSDPEDRRIELLEHETANTVKLRILTTRADQAKVDFERYRGALQRNAATDMETQHAQLAHRLTLLELEEEKFRLEQLGRSLNELLAQRERMRLYAVTDGYIEEINVEEGMTVDKNIPALRLVSIDPFDVDFSVPVNQAIRLREGGEVRLCAPGTEDCRTGVIRQVGKIAILSSGNLRIRVRAENQQKLPTGMMLEGIFESAD